jgi:hypothetical protein
MPQAGSYGVLQTLKYENEFHRNSTFIEEIGIKKIFSPPVVISIS